MTSWKGKHVAQRVFAFRNPCPLTQCAYLQMLLNIYCVEPVSILKRHLNDEISFLIRGVHRTAIGSEELTEILTRLILRLENVEILVHFFCFVEQTRTELCFVQTCLAETRFNRFENALRPWLADLLLTMDLFDEELYTQVKDLRMNTAVPLVHRSSRVFFLARSSIRQRMTSG